MCVTEIEIVPITPQNGLVGFASCVINNQFFLGNLGIHSSPNSISGYRLTYPTKKLPNNLSIKIFHPITAEAGQEVERAVINAYLDLMKRFRDYPGNAV